MKNLFAVLLIITSFLYQSCSNDSGNNNAAPASDTVLTYRPLYHFTTDSNWINDPNGLVYANGKYHLFAQYNPFGDKWGHMSWAHATSTDLFSWQQQPLAIPEYPNANSTSTMIFSGSAVVDSFNTSGLGNQGQMPFVAVYTSHIDSSGTGISQTQSLAYSLDEGQSWQQYKANPVLDIHLKDFRDPKVFWYAAEKKWIMAVVKSVEYKVQFYESSNLKEWKYLSEFSGIGNREKIWECPDIFQLPIEGSNKKKWVLSLSAGHPQKDYLAVQYFVGDFDGKKFTADALDYPLYIDYGKDFYAGVTYNNIPAADGRTIMISWANCWRYANDIPTKGFRGIYTVPRTLSLRNTPNGLRLIQQPVEEINKYEDHLYSTASVTLNNNAIMLDSAKGTSLDISFSLQPAAGAEAGINILKSEEEKTTIAYNSKTKTISLDRRKSGDTGFNAAFPGIETVHLGSDTGKINFRVLIDNSIVEVFINNGAYALTDLVFPRQHEGGVELFAQNGEAVFSGIIIKKVNKTLH